MSLWPTLLAPVTKLVRGVKERGWKGVAIQLYTMGDLKFGEYKGMDRNGNKYYENMDLPYGQHRWVEYADIHNPDATMIAPEWHGWIHHTFDEPITDATDFQGKFSATAEVSHAPYRTHLGKVDKSAFAGDNNTNLTQHRHRAYGIGSHATSTDQPERYYKQPGHALSDMSHVGGMFKRTQDMVIDDPVKEYEADPFVPKKDRKSKGPEEL